MESNHHYGQANIGQDYFHQPAPNDHAAVQATLALAYEQRTANLIAFFATVDARPSVYTEIAERLGVK